VSKSKSDLFGLVALLLLFAGCDSMRTPEPDSSGSRLRASMAAFVIGESNFGIYFGRPMGNPAEPPFNATWIDESNSKVTYRRRAYTSSAGAQQPSYLVDSRIGNQYDMTGSVYLPGSPYLESLRIHGRLVWNASAPFSNAAGYAQRDSFDLEPQPGEKRRFLRNAVRAEIALRWPRLALSIDDSLTKWASMPESVQVFLEDWKRLCQARGQTSARFLYCEPYKSPRSFSWVEPDTSKIGWIMRYPELAQVVLSAGDSLWRPFSLHGYLIAALDSVPSVPVGADFVDQPTSYGYTFQSLSSMYGRMNSTMTSWRDEVGYYDLGRNSWYTQTTTMPYRITIQATPTCEAYKEWISNGPSDRIHKPHGNVAPFDGYYCQLQPDTMSFPRGDVKLLPADTTGVSTQPRLVFPALDTTTKSVLKANP